jgi:hypothetical protein
MLNALGADFWEGGLWWKLAANSKAIWASGILQLAPLQRIS